MEIDFLALATSIESNQSGGSSVLHGSGHWRRVAVAGLVLAEEVPECDRDLVLLFALLHDSQRLNEGEDSGHPARAADFAATLDLGIEAERLATLLYAIRYHTDGQTSADPTIGVCWDADRLNLWRVGIIPSPILLSIPQARTQERIVWASQLQHQSFEWADLLDSPVLVTPEIV
jgi:uncharacterized protein